MPNPTALALFYLCIRELMVDEMPCGYSLMGVIAVIADALPGLSPLALLSLKVRLAIGGGCAPSDNLPSPNAFEFVIFPGGGLAPVAVVAR